MNTCFGWTTRERSSEMAMVAGLRLPESGGSIGRRVGYGRDVAFYLITIREEQLFEISIQY
ncbi:hypothetical protein JXA80_11985 [bacterium]|nr:hypothetical protein [candidate division CSSED10-310 bacterium]